MFLALLNTNRHFDFFCWAHHLDCWGYYIQQGHALWPSLLRPTGLIIGGSAILSERMSTATLDDEYGRLRPHAFHLQLPPNHKTERGVPLVTIHAERKSRGIVRLARLLEVRKSFYGVGEQCGVGDDGDDDDEEAEDEDDLAEDEDDGFVEGGVVGGTPRNLVRPRPFLPGQCFGARLEVTPFFVSFSTTWSK